MYKQFSKFHRNRHLTLGQALSKQYDILKTIEFRNKPFKKKKKLKKTLSEIQKWNSEELWAKDSKKKLYL